MLCKFSTFAQRFFRCPTGLERMNLDCSVQKQSGT